jgi:hypothetical protein
VIAQNGELFEKIINLLMLMEYPAMQEVNVVLSRRKYLNILSVHGSLALRGFVDAGKLVLFDRSG